MRQMGWMDYTFIVMERPWTPQHICPVMVYDRSTAPSGDVTFDDIVRAVEACLPSAPTFRERLVRVPLGLDQAYWVEDADFDLEFHVRHLALPRPGNWRQFCTQVGRLHSRPLDLTRPPWEMTVVDGLDAVDGLPPGGFGIVLKVHHAAIDGMAGVQMITTMHDDHPSAVRDVVDDDWQPEPLPSTTTLLTRAGVHSITRPVNAARLVARNLPPMVREVARRGGGAFGGGMTRSPRTRFNAAITAHKVFDATQVPLEGMRAIKGAVPGATVNDAGLALIGGAMRRYLADKGELPAEPLTAVVPISTRTPDQTDASGNQVAMMVASMCTHIADPLERLAAIQAATVESKAAQQGVAAATLRDLSEAVPGALLGIATRAGAAFAGNAPVMANTLVTNTPGPRYPLYFAGARMTISTGCTPLANGAGLAHSINSYVDDFGINITACRELLPDIAVYTDCIQQSYAELLDGAGG
jgi:diacylglycerol O-acyltransferase / wax synthase